MSLMSAGPWRQFTEQQTWQAITVNMAYVVRVCLRDNGQETQRPWATIVYSSGETQDVEIPIITGASLRESVERFMEGRVK